jgi:RNA polymerase sigma factor (sigma-70 family)
MDEYRWLIVDFCVVRARFNAVEMSRLVHECDVELWTHIEKIRQGATKAELAAWVILRCRNAVKSYRRLNKVSTLPIEVVGDDDLCVVEGDERNELLDTLSEGLTAHERQIVELVRGGYSSKEIADILGIKPESVDVERSRIIGKMRQRAEKWNGHIE